MHLCKCPRKPRPVAKYIAGLAITLRKIFARIKIAGFLEESAKILSEGIREAYAKSCQTKRPDLQVDSETRGNVHAKARENTD